MNPTTVRILVALDVPADQLQEVYPDLSALFGSHHHAADLAESVSARLSEFYPANDGYVTPLVVTAVAVDSDCRPISEADLRGLYEVGVEGVAAL